MPDILAAELVSVPIEEVRSLGLVEDELPGEQMAQVARLMARYRTLSAQDVAVLVLARWKDWLLLSSDRPLRTAAEREGVRIHGTLWLLDRMVEKAIVTSETAADALERMLNAGSRLPHTECRERLRQWRGPVVPPEF